MHSVTDWEVTRSDRPTAARRRSRRRIVGLVLVAGFVGAASARASGADRLEGIWQLSHYEAHLAPADGEPIPFTPVGRDLYNANQARKAIDPAADTTQTACAPLGVPRSLATPYPFSIVASSGQLAIVYEVNRAFRIVLLQPEHNDPQIWDPSYMGDSIGRWEGDTLVIDTRNFIEGIWLDDAGLPHSSELHVVERLRAPGNNQLEALVTLDDPKIFSRPWTARLLFHRQQRSWLATDWVCGEAHRDVGGVRGAKSYR